MCALYFTSPSTAHGLSWLETVTHISNEYTIFFSRFALVAHTCEYLSFWSLFIPQDQLVEAEVSCRDIIHHNNIILYYFYALFVWFYFMQSTWILCSYFYIPQCSWFYSKKSLASCSWPSASASTPVFSHSLAMKLSCFCNAETWSRRDGRWWRSVW